MSKTIWIDLQHFAGEGAAPGGEGGGEGSAGESAAVAGQQADALEALGVPKDKAKRFRERRAGKEGERNDTPTPPPRNDTAAAAAAELEQTAAETAPRQEEAAAAERKTLAQLLKEDPQLNAEAQEIIKKRLGEYDRSNGKYREALEKLTPSLKLLQKVRYGIDGDVDPAALAEKIEKDESLYEKLADELGTSTDTARKLYEREQLLEAEQTRREAERQQREQREHFDELWRQGEELKKIYPTFDLVAEMQNPAFRRMVMPGGGLTVQQAFQALHYQELRQAEAAVIAERAKVELAKSIAAGQSRPVEGKRAQAASSGSIVQPMSREDREALKRRIYQSGYTGQKIYPGG